MDTAISSVKRVAFDIGSGSTKMQVATVSFVPGNPYAVNIDTVISREVPVSFGADFMKSSNGHLSSTIMVCYQGILCICHPSHCLPILCTLCVHTIWYILQHLPLPLTLRLGQNEGLTVLRTFIREARDAGFTAFSAIATEVFRKSKNGHEYLEAVRQLGVPIMLVTQLLEAELGFNSVVAVGGLHPGIILIVSYHSSLNRKLLMIQYAPARDKAQPRCGTPVEPRFKSHAKKTSRRVDWDLLWRL